MGKFKQLRIREGTGVQRQRRGGQEATVQPWFFLKEHTELHRERSQRVKNLPAVEETRVRPLGRKDPQDLEDMATHSSILAWQTPQRSLVGYSPWGRKESDTTERLTLTELNPQQMEDVSILLHSREVRVQVKVAQWCPTLCDPVESLQARLLEWVAFPFSRGSSQPRDRTQVSRTAGGFFTS